LVQQEEVEKKHQISTTLRSGENTTTVPHATLVQEEEDFDTRLRKMFKGAMAVEVVQADNEEIEIIETASKKWKRKKRTGIVVCLLLLLIIIVVVPTVVITQQSDKNLNTQQNNTNLIPTFQVSSMPPSFETITLYLKLGKDSNAIGFQLSCGKLSDDVIEKRTPAFVSKPGGVATVVYRQVRVDRECTVEVTNTAGTGLQPDGFLRIHQGATISSDNILVEVPGNFTDEASGVFQVKLIASQVPSIAPTGNPSNILSLSPSEIPSTSNFPTATRRPTYQLFDSPPVLSPISGLFPSVSPTFLSYSILVDIELDFFPIETGWNLTCDGISKASFAPGSYIDPTEEILISYDDVNYNAECLFVIVDTARDGICCSNGFGRYKITVLGDVNTTLLEFEDDGEFIAESQKEFRVGQKMKD